MKPIHTALSLAFLLAVSCKEKEEKTETVVEETSAEKTAPESVNEVNCYRKVIGKDSIIVTVERAGDSIHGNYHWKPYEKDKKISSYKGVMNGNTANVVAESQQEGMNFKEEVVFIVSGKTLEVKYGEMVEGKDGIWKYKDMNATTTQLLDQVDCE